MGGGGWFKPTKPRGRLWIQRELILDIKEVGTWDARGWFYNRTGWDLGGDRVGLRSSLGLVPNYIVLVLGNEGGCRHTWGLGIG